MRNQPRYGAEALWDALGLLGLALTWRAVFLLAMPRVLDTADAIHYIEAARHFAAGDFLGADPKIPVLYPLLGALAHRLFADFETACRAVSFAASCLLVLPVYAVSRGMHGRAAARTAGLIAAVWPWLADYACRVSTESLAVFWWLSGAALLLGALRHGGWRTWLAPSPWLALYWTRPEGMFLMLAALALGAAATWHVSRWRMVPFAVLASAALALNSWYVHAVTGAASANYRVGFIVEEFDLLRFAHSALDSVTDVLPVMLGPVLMVFLGAGLIARGPQHAAPREWRGEAVLLGLAAVQWGASWFVLSPAPRYFMAPLIVLSLWSARGVAVAAAQAAELRFGRWLHWIPVASLVAFFLAGAVVTLGAEHAGRRPREPREYKDAGLWMREHLEPGLIFTRKPQVAYYADMPSTGPALTESLAEALDRARAAGARYLVVDERYTAQEAPGLRPLLDPAQAPPGLSALEVFDAYPECRVVVYAIGGVP